MNSIHEPADIDEVQRLVQWALGERKKILIEGRGSKRALRPIADGAQRLSLHRLAGVVDYQPEELVLTAFAGTPIADIEALLGQRNQMLAFEPPDLGAMLGGPPDNGSIGGVVACNLSGPRRLSAGAARDHFLGFDAINGRGEHFKSGGKVMKNVTGYDLSKLMAGSRGTLAVMNQLNIKVLPMPESTATVLLRGHTDRAAIALLCRAMGTPHDISGAAHLPASVASRSEVPAVRAAGDSVTALRLEGIGPSVAARVAALSRELAEPGQDLVLDTLESRQFWRELRDARPLWQPASGNDRELWRISVPPAEGAAVVSELASSIPGLEAQYDWSGGLIWLAFASNPGAGAALRRAIAPAGGHAAPIASPATAVRPAHESESLIGLSERIRESFDPRGVFA